MKISPTAIIDLTNVALATIVEIGEYSVIGRKANYLKKRLKTNIKTGCTIGSHVIIYEGVLLAKNTQIEDFCRIGERTKIGHNCRLIYGVKVYGNVRIGNNCIIGGFICEDVKIGNNCRIFGEVVHTHKVNPSDFGDINKWDQGGEKAPIIEDNVFIGFGAKVIGHIKVGKGSYILPNTIVNRDVPANSLVKNVGETSSIRGFFNGRGKKN